MIVNQGSLEAKGLKVAIVASRFNETITKRLVEGAEDCFVRHGVAPEDVELFWVPGAFELPLLCRRLAESRDFDALVAAGVVIRGDTAHFDYVAGNACNGVARASYDTGVPMTLAVLTTDTPDQARERAGGKYGNKGFEAAMVAIEMAALMSSLKASRGEGDARGAGA